MKCNFGRIAALGLLTFLLVPTGLFANERGDGAKKVAKHLNELREEAAEARREAAQLESLTRNSVGYDTHAFHLTEVKERINRMGVLLAELEEMKHHARGAELKAIEATRPVLEAAAGELKRAIRMANQRGAALKMPEYKESLRGVWENSDKVYEHLDAHLEYGEARARVEGSM